MPENAQSPSVSGPGRMSQRTDRQAARWVPSQEYGDGKDLMELQTSAPLSAQPSPPRGGMPSARQSAGPTQEAPITPLFAPTERPGEPVTAGMPFGPGPGPSQPDPGSGRYAQLVEYLPMLEQAAAWPDAPPTFRALVRFLQGQGGR